MDQELSGGRRRLPGRDEDQAAAGAGMETARTRRDDGVRGARRMSNLTAATLIAGVAVTSGYFAHAAATGSPPAGSAGSAQQDQRSQPAGHRAHLTHPVVTSGGSGVTAGGGGSGAAGGTSGGGQAAAWRDN